MAIVRFTDANDTIVLGSDATFLGLGGDDVYVFEPSFIPANAQIRVGDSQGDNTLRFPDGLEIVQSDVSTLGNGGVSIRLTLSNGTTVDIDNAEGFDFEVGGDVAGNDAVPQTLTEFVEDTLGTTVPAPNQTSQGGAVTIGELPVVSISGADQVEGDPGDAPREVVFTLQLDEPNLQRDVTVTLQLDQGLVTGDAATAGDDFAAFPSTTVIIPKGATTTEVPVDIIPDLVPENAEGIGLKIVAADGATIADDDDLPQPGETSDDGDPSAVADIIDDDVAAPVPLVQISGGTLLEGDDGDAPVLSFNLDLVDPAAPGTSLSTTVPVDVTVQTGAAGDTATAGSDYTPVTTTITIPAGATVGQVDVTLSGDEDIEDDETFTATITNVVNADAASVGATATGTIENDDGPTLTIRDTSVQEGDDGTTATMSFTVESSEAIAEDVKVDVATFDQSSAGAADFTAKTETVTIAAGTTSTTFEVEVIGDDLEEGDETFGARLSNPVVVGKPNVTARLDDDEATGTIIDDDGSFVLTEQTDVFTTTQNTSGGVFADDGQNIFIANEATLNPSDELEGGGQPPAPAGTGPFPPLEGDFFDQLFYSTDTTVAAGATVNEAGFSVTEIEQLIVQSNAVDKNGDAAPVVFDMSNTDVETVGSRNSASGVQFTELARRSMSCSTT